MGKMKDTAIQLAEQGINVTPEPSENLMELIKRASMIKYTIIAEDCIGCPNDGNCELQDETLLEDLLSEDDYDIPEEFQDMKSSNIFHGLPPEFIEFIYTNNIVNNFFSNLPLSPSASNLFKDIPPCSLLSSAFYWSTSPEGHNFWSGINTKWQKLCASYKATTSDELVELVEDDEDDLDLPPEEFERYVRYNTPTNSEECSAQSELDSLLDSRSIYGSFKEKAMWIQDRKQYMRETPKWEYLGSAEKEALDNIVQKMGSILYGEFHEDNWNAIQTYAALVVRND